METEQDDEYLALPDTIQLDDMASEMRQMIEHVNQLEDLLRTKETGLRGVNKENQKLERNLEDMEKNIAGVKREVEIWRSQYTEKSKELLQQEASAREVKGQYQELELTHACSIADNWNLRERNEELKIQVERLTEKLSEPLEESGAFVGKYTDMLEKHQVLRRHVNLMKTRNGTLNLRLEAESPEEGHMTTVDMATMTSPEPEVQLPAPDDEEEDLSGTDNQGEFEAAMDRFYITPRLKEATRKMEEMQVENDNKISILQSKNFQLYKEHMNMTVEKYALINKRNQLTLENLKLKSQNKSLGIDVHNANDAFFNIHEKYEEGKKQNAELIEKQAQLQVRKEAEIGELKYTRTQKCVALRDATLKLCCNSTELQRLGEDCNRLQSENERLKSEVTEMREQQVRMTEERSRNEAMSERYTTMTLNNLRLTSENEEMTTEMEDIKEKQQQKQTQLLKLTQDNKDLYRENREMKQRVVSVAAEALEDE